MDAGRKKRNKCRPFWPGAFMAGVPPAPRAAALTPGHACRGGRGAGSRLMIIRGANAHGMMFVRAPVCMCVWMNARYLPEGGGAFRIHGQQRWGGGWPAIQASRPALSCPVDPARPWPRSPRKTPSMLILIVPGSQRLYPRSIPPTMAADNVSFAGVNHSRTLPGTNDGLRLARRLRRRANLKPSFVQRLVHPSATDAVRKPAIASLAASSGPCCISIFYTCCCCFCTSILDLTPDTSASSDDDLLYTWLLPHQHLPHPLFSALCKRQYLFTCKITRYCCLALHGCYRQV